MIARLLLITSLLAAPAYAQDKDSNAPPKRIRSVITYGDEQCPKSSDPEELVVCANGGDSPYRIPKRFRNEPKDGPSAQAWTNRVEAVQDINNNLLPTGCSTIGPGSYSSCNRDALRAWAQDRVNKRAAAARASEPDPDGN